MLVEGKAEPLTVRCRRQVVDKGGVLTFCCVDQPAFQVRTDATLCEEIEDRPDDRWPTARV